jgi:hypothetical protein
MLPPLLMLAGWIVSRFGGRHRLAANLILAAAALYVVYLASDWFGPPF